MWNKRLLCPLICGLLLCLMLPWLFAGCSGSGVYSEEQGATYFHAVCEAYTGQRRCRLAVGDNACIGIQCAITCKEGRIGICISDKAGNEVYRSEGIGQNTNFTVQITEPDTYTISVDAAGYTGGFSFDWETVGAAAVP